MRLRYLSYLGLGLILNGLTLSTSHPVQDEGLSQSGMSQSDKDFLSTLDDYLSSVENLEKAKSKSMQNEEEGISPQETQFFPQILPLLRKELEQQQRILQQEERQKQQKQQQQQDGQPIRMYEQWSDYPTPNSGSQIPRTRELSQSPEQTPKTRQQQQQDVVVFRLPQQPSESSDSSTRGRRNRQKNRQNRQRSTTQKYQEFFEDYDPLTPESDEGQVVKSQENKFQPPPQRPVQQYYQPQPTQMQTIVGRPRVLIAQPRPQELLAQPQTLAEVSSLPQGQARSPKILIAQVPNSPSHPRPLIAVSGEGQGGFRQGLENELEKPNLMGQLGSWLETGKKIMYLPRGIVDVIDKTMSYAEQNPYVTFVMDKVADQLFGSTKGGIPVGTPNIS